MILFVYTFQGQPLISFLCVVTYYLHGIQSELNCYWETQVLL